MSPLTRLVLAAPLLCGCFIDNGGAADDGGTGDADDTQGQSVTSNGGETPGGAADPTMPTAGATEPSPPTTGATDTGDPTVAACDDPRDRPLDSPCTDASGCGCQSGTCGVTPILGGLCGECLGDVDCGGGGCTAPDPVHQVGSRCNQGEPGAGCQSDAACFDAAASRCAEIYIIEGILEVRTCSACAAAADCFVAAPHCAPHYDLEHFTGVRSCVADATVADGQGCDLTPVDGAPLGNKSCISGFCGAANVQGLLKLGICGACNSAADCPMGACIDPIVDIETSVITPAKCM